jgi:hypothetical protein
MNGIYAESSQKAKAQLIKLHWMYNQSKLNSKQIPAKASLTQANSSKSKLNPSKF